jgi:hypothetical protein
VKSAETGKDRQKVIGVLVGRFEVISRQVWVPSVGGERFKRVSTAFGELGAACFWRKGKSLRWWAEAFDVLGGLLGDGGFGCGLQALVRAVLGLALAE